MRRGSFHIVQLDAVLLDLLALRMTGRRAAIPVAEFATQETLRISERQQNRRDCKNPDQKSTFAYYSNMRPLQ